MAITAYCGVMGSGKSYEVVSGPLLDAVAKGRRVVCNIDGINEAAIHSYVADKRGLPLCQLGRVVYVRTEDSSARAFIRWRLRARMVLKHSPHMAANPWPMWNRNGPAVTSAVAIDVLFSLH